MTQDTTNAEISLRVAHPERPFKSFVIISHVFVRFHKLWEVVTSNPSYQTHF